MEFGRKLNTLSLVQALSLVTEVNVCVPFTRTSFIIYVKLLLSLKISHATHEQRSLGVMISYCYRRVSGYCVPNLRGCRIVNA